MVTVTNLLKQLKRADKKQVASLLCISYQNARNENYDTWEKVYPTIAQNDVAIEFVCQLKTAKRGTDDQVRLVQEKFDQAGEGVLKALCRGK